MNEKSVIKLRKFSEWLVATLNVLNAFSVAVVNLSTIDSLLMQKHKQTYIFSKNQKSSVILEY